MGDDEVKLYTSWRSPFGNRVDIALKLKGVEYQRVVEDLLDKSPDLLRHNPVHKKIPVLVHGSKVITESQVILEYIDETWDSGAPILPRDPYQRARARFWAKFIDDKLLPSIHRGLNLGEEKAMEEALENMKILDKELEGKRFFGGERVGFVDIVANSIGYWLGLFEAAVNNVVLTEESFPSLCRWRDEFLNCQVIRETLPVPKDKLVAKFREVIFALRGDPTKK